MFGYNINEDAFIVLGDAKSQEPNFGIDDIVLTPSIIRSIYMISVKKGFEGGILDIAEIIREDLIKMNPEIEKTGKTFLITKADPETAELVDHQFYKKFKLQ